MRKAIVVVLPGATKEQRQICAMHGEAAFTLKGCVKRPP